MDKLIKAVRENLSSDSSCADQTLRDVSEHGADGGFSGFTYYADTVPFAMLHIDEIRECLIDEASEFGLRSAASMVAGFSCLENQGLSDDDINRVLWSPSAAFIDHKDDVTTLVLNALAWYALEKVANLFILKEEEVA
tara:strand:- start:1134 stop:1547 length:414 start_codon:yes stop_codon:yes gene_type:complete